jgi:hypothetical protein
MRLMRLGLGAVLACLAIVAGVAPALAGSTGNPQWEVGGSILKSGETKEIAITASGAQKLKTSEFIVACSGVGLESGSHITGGVGATPGGGSEQIVYSGCVMEKATTEEAISGCLVNSTGSASGTVKSEHLAVKLAYTTPSAAEHEEANTLTVLKPESGTSFLQLELSGENCPFPGNGKYNVEGEVVMKNLEGATEKSKHTAEAPSTSVKVFYLNNGGLPKEEKVKTLKIAGSVSGVYIGNVIGTTVPEGGWAAVN